MHNNNISERQAAPADPLNGQVIFIIACPERKNMSNKWDEMREAYKEAENTIKAADFMIADMAKMISGKLHNIELNYQNVRVLRKLKMELNNFNLHTRQWSK